MKPDAGIPLFALYGEVGGFPDLVHVERIHDRASVHDWRIAPHRHAALVQLLVIDRGRAIARLDGAEIVLEDRGFVLVPPQVVHGFTFRAGCEGWVLSLPLPLVTAAGMAGSIPAPVPGQADDGLLALVGLFEAAFVRPGGLRAAELTGLAQAILAHLLAGHAAGPADAAAGRMQRLAGLITAHMGDGWGPSDYAAALGVTAGHLNRLCQAATGLTTRAVIAAATHAEGCRLLAFTRIPVSEIGWRLGFADAAHFSRRFRAAEGVSPRAYRQRINER